jgi:hypothetical protein
MIVSGWLGYASPSKKVEMLEDSFFNFQGSADSLQQCSHNMAATFFLWKVCITQACPKIPRSYPLWLACHTVCGITKVGSPITKHLNRKLLAYDHVGTACVQGPLWPWKTQPMFSKPSPCFHNPIHDIQNISGSWRHVTHIWCHAHHLCQALICSKLQVRVGHWALHLTTAIWGIKL